MIAALWSNSNYDGDGKEEPPRTQAIETIEQNFDDVMRRIQLGANAPEPEDNTKDNPFFTAAERGMQKIQQPRNDEGNVADVVEEQATYSDLDQT